MTYINVTFMANFAITFFHRVFGALLLAMMLVLPAQAGESLIVAGYVPPGGGKLYANTGDFSKFICDFIDPGRGWGVIGTRTLDSPGADQPTIYIKCENSEYHTKTEMGPFAWSVSCSDGTESHSARSMFAPGACQGSPSKSPPDNQCPCHGNPINYVTRAKTQIETDYASPLGLAFTRIYSSLLSISDPSMPAGWRHNFQMHLEAMTLPNYPGVSYYEFDPQLKTYLPLPLNYSTITFYRADGSTLRFKGNTDGLGGFIADADSKYSVTTTLDANGTSVSEFALRTPSDDIERYDGAGRLLSIDFKSGRKHTLVYGDVATPLTYPTTTTRLIAVSDNLGRTIQFAYDGKGRLISVTDPGGNSYAYTIDANNNLTKVTYPDGLSRTYHYGETAYTGSSAKSSHRLTGISDETSAGSVVRFATFKYNVSGDASSTEHAGGVDKFTFKYEYDYPQGITDPLGTQRYYTYLNVNGVKLEQSVDKPEGDRIYASTTYDANSNFKTRTDFNGVATAYTFDLYRNLETKRVEASGRAEARTITTEWHPTFRLPLRVAEPKRITTYTYDAAGNQTSKSVQATSDSNGAQGMAAAATGLPRTWSATYNNIGQVLTTTGPRTDVVDTTSYAYDDATGNLLSVTNPAGQVTSYSNYDVHGHPGRISAPNGVVTDLTYTVRGWLESMRVTAGGLTQLSQYGYDGVGHLTRFTAPDGSVTNYSYDAAQRLVGISDSLGNSIAYTLDAMGNRTAEKVSDPGGTLSRQITRTYDALNRLQQQTGGAL